MDARANIKQQTWTVRPFQKLTLNKLWKFGRRIVKTLCTYFQFNSIKCIIYLYNITFRLTNVIPEWIIFVGRGITVMSETCWVYKKSNKIASDIWLVFYSSAITRDWSASDREYMLSNDGFSHALDCMKCPLDRVTVASPLLHSKTRGLQNHTVVCGLSDRRQSPWWLGENIWYGTVL